MLTLDSPELSQRCPSKMGHPALKIRQGLVSLGFPFKGASPISQNPPGADQSAKKGSGVTDASEEFIWQKNVLCATSILTVLGVFVVRRGMGDRRCQL